MGFLLAVSRANGNNLSAKRSFHTIPVYVHLSAWAYVNLTTIAKQRSLSCKNKSCPTPPKQPSGKDGKKRPGAVVILLAIIALLLAVIIALLYKGSSQEPAVAQAPAVAETPAQSDKRNTAPQDDAWVARLNAWADEFQIPEKDFPRDKAALLALRELDLDREESPLPKITWLPPEIGKLQQLQTLELWGNQLSSLPAEIGQLQQLRVLYLNGNQLSSLPAEIGQLRQLRKLWLDFNQLSTLPAEITQLRQLETLDIRNNPKLRLTPAQEQFLQGVKEVER